MERYLSHLAANVTIRISVVGVLMSAEKHHVFFHRCIFHHNGFGIRLVSGGGHLQRVGSRQHVGEGVFCGITFCHRFVGRFVIPLRNQLHRHVVGTVIHTDNRAANAPFAHGGRSFFREGVVYVNRIALGIYHIPLSVGNHLFAVDVGTDGRNELTGVCPLQFGGNQFKFHPIFLARHKHIVGEQLRTVAAKPNHAARTAVVRVKLIPFGVRHFERVIGVFPAFRGGQPADHHRAYLLALTGETCTDGLLNQALRG